MSIIKISLPPKHMFLRYPLLTFFNHVGNAKFEEKTDSLYIEYSSAEALHKAIDSLLNSLLEGKYGFSPNVPVLEMRSKLKMLRWETNSAGIRCDDVAPFDLVECYLGNVVRRLSPAKYVEEISKAFSVFDNGYKNDTVYGIYSAPSILVPGQDIDVRMGLHSIVAGLAGLWLGGIYTDLEDRHRYILLANACASKDAISEFDRAVSYLKAKSLSDVAVKVLTTLILSSVGVKALYAEFINAVREKRRPDGRVVYVRASQLVKLDDAEIAGLAEIAKKMDRKLRERLIIAIAVGGNTAERIAHTVYKAALENRYEEILEMAYRDHSKDRKNNSLATTIY